MKQPDIKARREYFDNVVEDIPEKVRIPGTGKTVRVTGMKPYTMQRLTRLWLERDDMEAAKEDSGETTRSLCREPYFAAKEAALIVLNGYWKRRLFWPFLWRWWALWRGWTESQYTPIIAAGKKKVPLTAHWTNMAFSVDMRTDWMTMTRKEAELYRAELLSAASRLSSRNTPSPEGQDGSSSGLSGSETGSTTAS